MDVNEAKELLRNTILEKAKEKLKKNSGFLGKFSLSDDGEEVLYWTLFPDNYGIMRLTLEESSPYLIPLRYVSLPELIQLSDEL